MQWLKVKSLRFIMAISLLPILASAAATDGTFWGFDNARANFHGIIWQAPVSPQHDNPYAPAVEAVLQAFSNQTGRALAPGVHRRVAIKIYANSGPGMQTPLDLTRAVASALQRRGFQRDEIFLVDARESQLRAAGYLPPLSRMALQGPYFEGLRVFSLDEGTLRSHLWFYDSPLPREFTSPLGRMLLVPDLTVDPTEARRSYLPAKLLTDVDFWINLPVAVHHPVTEFSGALANASLWNVTNNIRFLASPANAPVAIAEIAAIPEIQDTWALNIVSLRAFQYIGGPSFNSNYTQSRPEIWASVDPVILDANLGALLNQARQRSGFRPLSSLPEFIELSMRLGLGFGHTSQTLWQRLDTSAAERE